MAETDNASKDQSQNELQTETDNHVSNVDTNNETQKSTTEQNNDTNQDNEDDDVTMKDKKDTSENNENNGNNENNNNNNNEKNDNNPGNTENNTNNNEQNTTSATITNNDDNNLENGNKQDKHDDANNEEDDDDNINQHAKIPDVSWDETNIEGISEKDFKQVLHNRNVDMKENREETIKYLKETQKVIINYNDLLSTGLLAELRLRKLSSESAKKATLIKRLIGDEPPKKKQRTSPRRKSRISSPNECFVVMYLSSSNTSVEINKEGTNNSDINNNNNNNENDNNNNNNNNNNNDDNNNDNDVNDANKVCLGVYKDERMAYEAAVERLLKDIENKYKNNNDEYSNIQQKIDDYEIDDYKEKLEFLKNSLATIFDSNSRPYVRVDSNTLHYF